MSKKTVLIILDGWGIAENPEVSAIDKAHTPFVDSLYQKYSNTQLRTSGLAVGLPEGQMGNSEVGHMNLGAGRVVYQDLVKINRSVDNGELANKTVLKEAFLYAKEHQKSVHLIGLLSDGGIHSHIKHVKGLISAAHREKLSKVFIHAFTDGRDTNLKAGLSHTEDLEKYLAQTTGKIASVIGRYYAMDRDKRWERIKLAYDLLVNGIGEPFPTAKEAILSSYEKGINDEFIKPKLMIEADRPVAIIQEDDVVICFNFRTDRGRQITMALSQQNFYERNMHKLKLHYLTMTCYDESFKGVKVIYEKDPCNDTLGEVLAKEEKMQIRIAETEKYPHVIFFFSGGREHAFEGEKRILIASPKVASYDIQPEMSAYQVRDAAVSELKDATADFVCLNFSNPDMVGHTGNMEATIKACETVDQCTRDVVEAGLIKGYTFIILADHGNADCMINRDLTPNTTHTTQPVPCFLVSNDENNIKLNAGLLSDIAPTLLDIMGLEKPIAMTGKSLLT